jgi:hypothetical protein
MHLLFVMRDGQRGYNLHYSLLIPFLKYRFGASYLRQHNNYTINGEALDALRRFGMN